MLEALVWNSVTGNLVSGHQRIKILDDLEGSSDYMLTVAVVELDPKAEKEQNSFFNSTSAQGEFDFDMLLDLFEDGVDPFEAGFTQADLNIIGYDLNAKALVTGEQEEAEGEIDDFYSTPKATTAGKPEEKPAHSVEEIKAAKQKIIDAAAERMDEGERYVSIIFQSYNEKTEFMKRLGFDKDDLFIQAELVLPKIKFD